MNISKLQLHQIQNVYIIVMMKILEKKQLQIQLQMSFLKNYILMQVWVHALILLLKMGNVYQSMKLLLDTNNKFKIYL